MTKATAPAPELDAAVGFPTSSGCPRTEQDNATGADQGPCRQRRRHPRGGAEPDTTPSGGCRRPLRQEGEGDGGDHANQTTPAETLAHPSESRGAWACPTVGDVGSWCVASFRLHQLLRQSRGTSP